MYTAMLSLDVHAGDQHSGPHDCATSMALPQACLSSPVSVCFKGHFAGVISHSTQPRADDIAGVKWEEEWYEDRGVTAGERN